MSLTLSKPTVWGTIIGNIVDQTDLVTWAGGAFLKLDQTIEQYIVSGSPHFQKGLVIKLGEKLILDG